ncbi:MAG TPA: putative sulfate exporter family transporter [Pseudolabrys sp.]|nr:putative sulfate exporter family transporter [Pseudolabrys sp.]
MQHVDRIRAVAPGLLFSAAVAAVSVLAAPYVAPLLPIPAMVLALLIGIALSKWGRHARFDPGATFSIKVLLRWAVALLGLRIALSDVVALGAGTALLVALAMLVTIVGGFLLAHLFRLNSGFGALAGAGTAVCGASATLATATVLPAYRGKETDIVFVVVAVNALSTVAMVLYPPLCALLGLDEQTTGVVLGATIHDVAQVVGAGYAVSEPVGNAAVIVKLFRVFLLLPVVLVIGWWFTRAHRGASAARVPVPVFALVFLLLCIVNSIVPSIPAIAPLYDTVRALLVHASTWGLMIAIGALGLKTSFADVATLGWRHVATVVGTTMIILVVFVACIVAIS